MHILDSSIEWIKVFGRGLLEVVRMGAKKMKIEVCNCYMCLLEEMYIASSANLVQSVILFCIKALTFLCFQRIGEFKTGV